MTAAALPIAFTPGFHAGPIYRDVMPLGLTVAEIVARVPVLPKDFGETGVVCIDGAPLERWQWINGVEIDTWSMTRPKARADGGCRITLHMPLQGGKLRSVLSLVATIALVAVGAWIATGGLFMGGALGGLFLGGSTSAQLLAAAVGILGRLALTQLAPPPAGPKNDTQGKLGEAGANGNVLAPGDAIPRVCGTLKIFPPLACQPLIDIAGDDEIVEAAYILAGPHQMTDVRIENAPIGDINLLQSYMLDGTQDAQTSLLNRYGVQRMTQFELQGFIRDPETPKRLRHQDNPERDLPQWRVETSRYDPDEIWIHLLWPQGMGDLNNDKLMATPFRLRMRIAGSDTWINLPELHFSNRLTKAIRKYIRLVWGAAPSPIVDAAEIYGAWDATHTQPLPVSLQPQTTWTAHSSFINNGAVYNSVYRVVRAYEGFTVYLDPAVFARGNRWEVAIMRGAIYRRNQFAAATYIYNGTYIYNFFDKTNGAGTEQLAAAQNEIQTYTDTAVDACMITRFASVWNDPPLPAKGNASIEIRARNVQVTALSCVASGLVPQWNGSEWAGLGTSDNPADHFRDVLAGTFTREPVEPDAIDNTKLLAWRTECTSKGYKIAAAFDGRDWEETLKAIAAVGYARLVQGQSFTVAWDRDTSGDAWTQLFTPRNANNFAAIKTFDKVPDAFRVTYRDKVLDYEPAERLVIRPGVAAEQVIDIVPVEVIGMVEAAKIDARFQHDLEGAYLRDHVVEFDVPYNALVSEIGDLVGLSHIMLSRHQASARIKNIEVDGGGLATAMTLDNVKLYGDPTAVESVADFAAIAELLSQGMSYAAAIVTAAGTTLTAALSAVAGETARIVFATPFDASTASPGNLVAIGPSSQIVGRYIVNNIEGTSRRVLRLTCMPEAPELWT